MLKCEEAQSQKIAVFEVEVNALHIMQALETYHSDLQVRRLKHMSVAQWATRLWLNSLPAGTMLVHVYNFSVRDLASVRPAFKNVFNKVPQIPIDSVVYKHTLTRNGLESMLPLSRRV